MEAVKPSAEDWIRECFNDCDFNFADNEFMYSLMTDVSPMTSSSSCMTDSGSNYSSPVYAMDMEQPSPCCPDFDYGQPPLTQHHDHHYHHTTTNSIPSCCLTDYHPTVDHKVLGVDLDLFQQSEFPACFSSCSSPCDSTSSSSPSSPSPASESRVTIKRENEDHHDYTCCSPCTSLTHHLPDYPSVLMPAPVSSSSSTSSSGGTLLPKSSAESMESSASTTATTGMKSGGRKVRRKKRATEASSCQTTGQSADDGAEKVFPCPYPECGNVYLKSSHLKVHIRRHTGEKPFKCTWQNCDWSFRRSDELSRHRRCHSGVKPYECSMCGKSFARSDHLSKHMKVHRRSGADVTAVLTTRRDCGTTGRRRRHYLTSGGSQVKSGSVDVGGSSVFQSVGRVIPVSH